MKKRAPLNRTIVLSDSDIESLSNKLVKDFLIDFPEDITNKTILGDALEIIPSLNKGMVDLLILDPPYNMSKSFNGLKFNRRPVQEYTNWLSSILDKVRPALSETASVYICGEWYTSSSIFEAASKYFIVRNRITWEREKGRGAKSNWKNSSEDIWFCTVSENYTFNVEDVKLRRRVLAPYRQLDGSPKDWTSSGEGNFRDTSPSNMWTDITVPFWSMAENTDHPTQKSEKLIAKLILASSNPGDVILDPFLGSGTTSVVASKLGRKYIGIEKDAFYCCLAEHRLIKAKTEANIQGYEGEVFWERNSLALQTKNRSVNSMSKEDAQTVNGKNGKFRQTKLII